MMVPLSACALVFTALIASSGAQIEMECPPDWISFDSSCYVFIDEFVPWTTAKVYCETLGARLLQVESKVENDFIAALIRNSTSGIMSVWLGLNDLVHEGRWVWNTNRLEPEFTNWAPGQPDNSHLHENGEDCVQVMPDGTWNDLWCQDFLDDASHKPSPVCEIDAAEEEIIG